MKNIRRTVSEGLPLRTRKIRPKNRRGEKYEMDYITITADLKYQMGTAHMKDVQYKATAVGMTNDRKKMRIELEVVNNEWE